MKKRNIVKKNIEFNDIIKCGKKYYSDIFYFYVTNSTYTYNRYGISVSKKVGNAVVRNKYKRRIKNIIDNIEVPFNAKNVIIISRPKLKFCDYNYIKKNIINMFNMIGDKDEK